MPHHTTPLALPATWLKAGLAMWDRCEGVSASQKTAGWASRSAAGTFLSAALSSTKLGRCQQRSWRRGAQRFVSALQDFVAQHASPNFDYSAC